MSIEDKKNDKFLFLKKLYDYIEGSSIEMVDMWELGKELSFDDNKTQNIVDYLTNEYLIEYKGIGGKIFITHNGIMRIEEYRLNSDSQKQQTHNDINKITLKTRRRIFDEIKIEKINLFGTLNDPDFLNRIYNLSELPSLDYRFKDAYGDIYQHTVLNFDWDMYWYVNDNRLNLTGCNDEFFLNFLCETLHPAVSNKEESTNKLNEIYNKHLKEDEFEIYKISEISGLPVFSGKDIKLDETLLRVKNVEIKKYLNTDYVHKKIDNINNAILTDTDIAIGGAKELIETTCKSILKQKGVTIISDWDILRLIKETNKVLDFKSKNVNESENIEKSIKQIFGGISSIIHGISELRNSYGTGHGKESDFLGLEVKFAKLIVGLVSDIVIFYLATNGESAELIE